MSERTDVPTLLGEIRKSRSVLNRICSYYSGRFVGEGRLGESTESAIVLAEVLENYYSCCETIFLRISQHFENSLTADAWYKDLLRKMTLEIPGVRPRVISDESYTCLRELLRFRHFRRYYFEFEYDWEKLRMVETSCATASARLEQEFDAYERFLAEIAEELE